MIDTEKFSKVEVASQEELRNWLQANHNQSQSVWLVTYKKNLPEKYLSTSEVLDELLCFGWIDGIRKKLDDYQTMQLISPRKVEHWTATYKNRAAKLIKEGRMTTAGFRSIELSKEKGLWDFMEDVDKLILPDDLMQALSTNKEAKSFFIGLNPSSKRFVLRWIKLSKTATTRKKRIEQIALLSAKKEKLKGS
ncbi:MAG: YdeI/OmpD-associated family protein [Sediminibacterium sp.]|jgi:uncharacterized protein YdeI (YjbR/CyaY-like superfamily)|nr:YdeI/OmpD-associated family protein [Sediminibacterium sp.]